MDVRQRPSRASPKNHTGVKKMGYYINPLNGTKEEFLKRFGRSVNPREFHDFSGPNALVCLVYTGTYNALGIAYNEPEKERFLIDDERAKRWYLVNKSSLPEDVRHVFTR